MTKTIIIKLVLGCKRIGPFTITDDHGNTIDTNVSKDDLIKGKVYTITDGVVSITIQSTGFYNSSKSIKVADLTDLSTLLSTKFIENNVSALYKHLNTPELFNSYYGEIHPYILEIPFQYDANTEILQSIKDYSKVFQYLPDGSGVFAYTNKIEVDDKYFNKLIVYNSQQSSGVLTLVPKPKNNLKEYLRYPIYNADSRSVIYTKSDGYYKVNNIYDLVKDKTQQLFITDCTSLSQDKQLNQTNIDYTNRSFRKSPIRAKETRLRMILDSTSNYRITSHLNIITTQQSYK